MKDNKIILYDLVTDGHHIKYVIYLVRYLYKKGNEVMFVTHKEDNRTKLLENERYNILIKYINHDSSVYIKKNFLNRNIHIWKGLEECFKLVEDWKANIMCLMCIDHNEIAFCIQTLKRKKQNLKIFAFLIWPYFIYKKNERINVFKRIYYELNKRILKKLLEKRILNGLFVHTDGIKKSIIKEFGWRSNKEKEKIIVIPDPTEKFYGYCSEEKAREKLKLPKNITLLLFFGKLRWDKGPDFLLEAIKNIKGNFKLVIAGQPDYINLSNIENYKKYLTEKDKIITRIKYISEEEVKYYFLAATAVILPYRKVFKGTSGILQNASAAGKPVIASNVGEIGRTVKKYSLGIIVKPESISALHKGIQKFLKNKDQIINTTIQNALNYAEQHSWQKMAEIVEFNFRR